MKHWIQIPKLEGETSQQAHADLPEGTFERELGKEGFFGPATHMYHKNPPTAWTDWQGPLRPRAFDLTKCDAKPTSPWEAHRVLHNAACKFRMWRTDGNNPNALYRNGDGDELLFIHEGEGDLYCDYGRLPFRDGDYIVLPRGTMWRLDCKKPVFALLIEATNSSYKLPDKGLVGKHAIFDTGAMGVPKIDAAFKTQQDIKGDFKIHIKRREAISVVTFPYNPLDAVGWHGDLMVTQINWRDIRPLASHRYHLPPSAHTTFVADRFVICTFVPRPFETDPQAIKVPFFHNNDDYDEVLFYHRGNFFSRDNIHAGMVTHHPCGFTHGPHPKALKNVFTMPAKETDEVAVMIDTRDALDVGDAATKTEWADYVKSWAGSVPGVRT